MTVLLSLHDVAPPFLRQLHALWSQCLALGARPALFVVPNWHGAHPIERDARFIDWLLARVDQGARIVLHGDRHDEVGTRRVLLDHCRAAGRTANEGEFLSLEYHEASARIGRGLSRLGGCGLTPIGFVPPAWLARAATRDAARDAGLAMTEDASRIHLLRQGRALRSPALRWSARTPLRAALSAVVADARWMAQRHAPLMRVALHPSDVDDASTRASLERSLERWLRVQPAGDYAALLRSASDRAMEAA